MSRKKNESLPFRRSSYSLRYVFFPQRMRVSHSPDPLFFAYRKSVVKISSIANDRENRMGARASVKQLSPIRCHCRAMLSVPEQWRTAGIVPLLRSDDYWVCDTISSASDRPPLSFFLRLHKYVSTSVYPCPTEMYPCPPWERERAKKSSGQTSFDANLDVEIARAVHD